VGKWPGSMGALAGKGTRGYVAAAIVAVAFGLWSPASSAAPPSLPSDTVAAVNGTPLPRAIFDRAFLKIAERYAQLGPGLPLDRVWSFRLEALSRAEEEQLIRNEARRRKLSVSPREAGKAFDAVVDEQVAQLKEGRGDVETQFAEFSARLGGPKQSKMREAEFRAWLRGWLETRRHDDIVMPLLEGKVKAKVTPPPAVGEQELRAQFATVTLRAILIRRPQGARDYDAAQEAARRRAEDLFKQIREGADFARLAATVSEDQRGKETGGLEKAVLVNRLAPERQQAVAALKIGEVSGVLPASLGYEIVRVEARGFELPADYEKRKPQLRAQLAEQKQEAAWEARVKAWREQAKVTVTDPELLGYDLMNQGRKAEAMPWLEAASRGADRLGAAGAASVYFHLAAYASAQERWAEAARIYAICDGYATRVLHLFPEARVATLFGLGFSYENLGLQGRGRPRTRAEEEAIGKALAAYQEVGRLTSSPSHHDRLRLSYARLGRPELAKQEEVWLAEYYQAAEERQKAQERKRNERR